MEFNHRSKLSWHKITLPNERNSSRTSKHTNTFTFLNKHILNRKHRTASVISNRTIGLRQSRVSKRLLQKCPFHFAHWILHVKRHVKKLKLNVKVWVCWGFFFNKATYFLLNDPPSTLLSRYLSNSASFFTASGDTLGAFGKQISITLILSRLPWKRKKLEKLVWVLLFVTWKLRLHAQYSFICSVRSCIFKGGGSSGKCSTQYNQRSKGNKRNTSLNHTANQCF